jgi:hypothetical protein
MEMPPCPIRGHEHALVPHRLCGTRPSTLCCPKGAYRWIRCPPETQTQWPDPAAAAARAKLLEWWDESIWLRQSQPHWGWKD